MNELQIFNNQEFGQVRVINKSGEPWFVAKDVCGILEIRNSRDAMDRLSESMKGVATTDTLGGRQEMNIVSEAGLYKLVFTSRKPEAERFTDWIATDVIPSIRKTGSYSIPTMSQAELTAMIAQNQVEIERTANRALEIASRADKQITNALDIFTAPPDKDWRQAMNSKMRAMCHEYGLSYLAFYGEVYKELEDLARVDLQARLTRLRKRMATNGATKTACNTMTKLEVVERDPKLRLILEGIVRKRQAKYAVDRMPETDGRYINN
jgi:prophage antirepressor-like protein